MNMIRTFVINLDKDIERMQFMHYQLTNLNIPYERVPAVYGRDYVPMASEYQEQIARRETGHALLPGELGCALSHKKVYEQIVLQEIPFALIFEDDVKLPDDFNTIINQQVSLQKKYRWEYLLFNYPVVGLPWIKKWFTSLTANFKKNKGFIAQVIFIIYSVFKIMYMIPLALGEGLRDKYRHFYPGPIFFYRPIYLAGAYIVTFKGAQKLLELSNPIIYPADRLPNQARVKKGLILRGYGPLVVFQLNKEFGSSILGLEGKDM